MQIPVYYGNEYPYNRRREKPADFLNSFRSGDQQLDKDVRHIVKNKKEAAREMVALVRKYPGNESQFEDFLIYLTYLHLFNNNKYI